MAVHWEKDGEWKNIQCNYVHFLDAFKCYLLAIELELMFCWLELPDFCVNQVHTQTTTYKQSKWETVSQYLLYYTLIHKILPLWSMVRGCASVPAWPIWQWPAGCCHHIPVSSGSHLEFHGSVHTLVHWSMAQPRGWGTAPTLAPTEKWWNIWWKYVVYELHKDKKIYTAALIRTLIHAQY